jgi:hypothetical protein
VSIGVKLVPTAPPTVPLIPEIDFINVMNLYFQQI